MTSTRVRAAILQMEGLELPQRTLSAWIARGIVVPSFREADHSPTTPKPNPIGRQGHLWTPSDLARIRLVARLRRAGVSMSRIEAILTYLSDQLAEVWKPRSTAELVVNGPRAFIVRRPGRPDVDVPSGQLRLRLDSLFEGNADAARAAA